MVQLSDVDQLPRGITGSATGRPSDMVRGSRDLVERFDPPNDFNFKHFRMRHMAAELIRTHRHSGVDPGSEAPEFVLQSTDGTLLRLSELRGRPVLLHFVSYTCPLTRGGASLMTELHRRYGNQVQFVDIVVRQAHPGERRGPYSAYADKLDDARRYKEEEAVVWPVVVDDLDGTMQRAYGEMSASIYLLDVRGRVAFYAMWGPGPRTTRAIDDLLECDGIGDAVGDCIDSTPHLGPAIVAGQGGPARGGVQSFVDLELGFPGALALLAIGKLARPVLKPLLMRLTPLSNKTRTLLAAAVGLGLVALGRCRRRTMRTATTR
jgi:thiol-disulfide isomerase/thioredoxin